MQRTGCVGVASSTLEEIVSATQSMQGICVCDDNCNWFVDYLSDRKQHVVMDEVTSSAIDMTSVSGPKNLQRRESGSGRRDNSM